MRGRAEEKQNQHLPVCQSVTSLPGVDFALLQAVISLARVEIFPPYCCHVTSVVLGNHSHREPRVAAVGRATGPKLGLPASTFQLDGLGICLAGRRMWCE
jgi:hypothetical protein